VLKRRILLPLLISLLIILLVFGGCFGSKSNDNASAGTPIEQLTARVAALETTVGSLANRPTGLTTNDLDGYAKKTDVPSLEDYAKKTDLGKYLKKEDVIEEFLAKLTAEDIAILKQKLGLAGSSGGVVSGEVTVVLDEPSPFEVYTDEEVTSPYRFTTTITNGTDDWYTVTYCVSFANVSGDGKGEVIEAELEVSSTSFGGVGIPFVPTYVPEEGNAWQVIFTPGVDFEAVIAPGKTVTLYHTIILETDGFELWEVTLTTITKRKM
jgi:hypothetical protein